MQVSQLKSYCNPSLKTGNIMIGVINAILSLVVLVTTVYFAWLCKPGGVHESPIGEAVAYMAFGVCIVVFFIVLAKFIVELFFIKGVILERSGIVWAYYSILLVVFFFVTLIFIISSPVKDMGIVCLVHIYLFFNLISILLTNSYYKRLDMRQQV